MANNKRKEMTEYLKTHASKLYILNDDGDEVLEQRFTDRNIDDYLSQYYGVYKILNKADTIDLFSKYIIISDLVNIKVKEIEALSESMRGKFCPYYIDLYKENLDVLIAEMNVFRRKLNAINKQIAKGK